MKTALSVALAVTVSCSGISCARIDTSPDSVTIKLDQQQIVEIANREAARNGRDLSKYDLPKASYIEGLNDGTWSVLYQGIPRGRGNYFDVRVNDRTGKCTLVPGE